MDVTSREELKRWAMSWLLKVAILFCFVATVIHALESQTSIVNLIVPPLSLVSCCLLLVWLRQKPDNIMQIGQLFAALVVTMVIICNVYFVGRATLAPSISLVESLPGPFAVSMPLPLMVLAVFVGPHRLKQTIVLYWVAIAAPVFLYLFTHLAELKTLRGQELAFLMGPVMIGQVTFFLLYARLRDVAECLYTERLQHYTKILEKQAVRQQAIDQTLTQIHNGPLQTLAVLLLDARGQKLGSSSLLIERLEQLNLEIRSVGESLVDQEHYQPIVRKLPATLEETPSEWVLRLGDGGYLDLNLPMNELFYRVFSATIARDLPHFKMVRAKIRNFEELQADLDFDQRRAWCLWLEEALCNVGKHAVGATRIKAIGKISDGHYIVTVTDNGCGQQTTRQPSATSQQQRLAKRLGGQFRRVVLPNQGTSCELSWRLSKKNP